MLSPKIDSQQNISYFTADQLTIKQRTMIHQRYPFSFLFSSLEPAFQECTGSCHENVPAQKAVSSDLQSTDGLTVLARIGIVTIFRIYIRLAQSKRGLHRIALQSTLSHPFLTVHNQIFGCGVGRKIGCVKLRQRRCSLFS